MKQKLILLAVLVGVIAFEVSRPEPNPAVSGEGFTIRYEPECGEQLAQNILDTLLGALSIRLDVEAGLEQHAGRIRLVIPVKDKLTPEVEQAFKLWGMVVNSVREDAPPIDLRAVYSDETLLVVKGGEKLKLLTKGKDLLFCRNVNDEEAADILEALEKVGALSGLGVAYLVDRTEDEYVLNVGAATADFSDQHLAEFEQNGRVFHKAVFKDHASRYVICTGDFQPRDGMSWAVAGVAPGLETATVDTVTVGFDDTVISSETAGAIATRVRIAGVPLLVSIRGNSDGRFRCRVTSEKFFDSAASTKLSEEYARFWGRELFSELPDARELQLAFLDQESAEVKSLEIREGNGQRVAHESNLMFYSKGTSEEMLEKVRNGLQKLGLFEKGAECAIRVSGLPDKCVVQMISAQPEATAEELAELKRSIDAMAPVLRDAMSPDIPFTFEITNLCFERIGNLGWSSAISR